MQMTERAVDWLEQRTSGVRSRYAADVFHGLRARPIDSAVCALYFTVATRRWGGYEDADRHLAAFNVGLSRCRRPRAVLDIGTGTGGAAAVVARRHPEARVVAVDVSRAMLRLARRRHAAANLEFTRASARRLPYADGVFDLVLAVNAAPDPVEVRRVAAPDAELLLAATTLPLRPPRSGWVGRWSELGFNRADAGEVDGGSWERYTRTPLSP